MTAGVKPQVAGCARHADNDPLNRTDTSGLRPSECSAATAPSECDRIIAVLKEYAPNYQGFAKKIDSLEECGNGQGGGPQRKVCVHIPTLEDTYATSARYRSLAGSFQDVLEHIVLHEYAHNFVSEYVPSGGDDPDGWPAQENNEAWPWMLYDFKFGRSSTTGDAIARIGEARRIREALERLHAVEGKDAVNEFMADCIAEVLKPSVRGGYWMQYLNHGCTDSGKEAAGSLMRGGGPVRYR